MPLISTPFSDSACEIKRAGIFTGGLETSNKRPEKRGKLINLQVFSLWTLSRVYYLLADK